MCSMEFSNQSTPTNSSISNGIERRTGMNKMNFSAKATSNYEIVISETLPGGGFYGGEQTETLPGGGFHGGEQTETLPGGGFH